MNKRVYLDWNASAPLRPEARRAMGAFLDVVGNPSSVHGEGRAAKAIIERARAGIAETFGINADGVVFTSGATEAAALALAGKSLKSAAIEHEAVLAWTRPELRIDRRGAVSVDDPAECTLQLANGETGIIQTVPKGIGVSDATQAVGKIPVNLELQKAGMVITSAHKLGGPKGVGALFLGPGKEVEAGLRGGGQEFGRRSGTENVAAIAGFGAAVAAAARDIENGLWEEVAELRNLFEDRLRDAVGEIVIIGVDTDRLPNTCCIAMPGWKSSTQVIQLDLDGFAISAGSACASGKVRERNSLRAIGVADEIAEAAVRVSIGPTTTSKDVFLFADAWIRRCLEHKSRLKDRNVRGSEARAA